MLNEKFKLKDGRVIYPKYLTKEERLKLKEELGGERECMWCCCRTDQKLYYAISENLSFYPEHKGYNHTTACSRYYAKSNNRHSAYVTDDSSISAVYLKFNPQNFSVPYNEVSDEEEEEEKIESNMPEPIPEPELVAGDESLILPTAKKHKNENDRELEYSLDKFVRCINFDTYTERVAQGKPILNAEYFSNNLYGRLKYIRIGGMSKCVRELTLENDGVRFFYASYKGCKKKEYNGRVSCNIQIEGKEKKVYGLFTFNKIYERALKKFHSQYGIEPDENTMVAGFQYYRKSKLNTFYKVVGRMHLFQVNKYGIYCRTNSEIAWYNTLIDFVNMSKGVALTLPPDETIISGVLEADDVEKKALLIFPTQKKVEVPEYNQQEFLTVILAEDDMLDYPKIHAIVKKLDQTE